jgi:hypothetical protein
MSNLMNLVKEKKDEILNQLKDAAQIEIEMYEDMGEECNSDVDDIVWNYADDYTYEFQSALSDVLEIDEDEVDDLVGNFEEEINNILF